MFGGLDLKGSSGKPSGDDDQKNKEEDAPEPTAMSAFSFLASSSTAPTASAAAPADNAASSGFSFLNSMTAASEPAKEKGDDAKEDGQLKEEQKPSSGMSAFNFLTTANNPTEESATTTDNASAPSSGFSFLAPPPTTTESSAVSGGSGDATPDVLETAPAVAAAAAPPAATAERTSSFGFMQSSDNATVSTISRDSPAPSLTEPQQPAGVADLLATANNANQPAGAGVVFGTTTTMMAAQKKPVKRRHRTAHRIGAGSATATQPPALPTPPRPTIPDVNNKTDTRNAAAEANRRAEAFLNEKIKTESNANSSSIQDAPIPAIQSVPSEDDSVIAAAKAAAEEAQNLEKQHHKQHHGFGGLFRSRTKDMGSPSGSQHKGVVSVSRSLSSTASVDGAADKLQKEQEQAKRAMAERQLQMMQQQTNNNNTSLDIPEPEETSTTGSFVAPSLVVPSKSSAPSSAEAATAAASFKPAVVAAAAPKPAAPIVVDVMSAPKPKTPTDIFHDMLDTFHNDVVRSMNEVTRLRQHHIGLLEERFVTTAKERLAEQQKQQAEMHQAAAADNEDYELADQMSQVIEKHMREQAEYASVLDNISRAIQELDRQKKRCVESVTKHFADTQSKLAAFQKEQESADHKDATHQLKRFSETSKQLSVENERLQADWKHLERDMELVAEERNELEKAISEQAGEFERKREEARASLTRVEEEIEDLRRLIQEKQKVAAELRTEAAGHDESVLKVRVKFARQLNRVQTKEMTIKDNTEEWESEKKAFDIHKEQHEAEVNEHSEAMLARDKLLDALNKEVEMADTFESIVAKEIGFEVASVDKNGASDNDELAQLQANVVKCEAAVSESKAALEAVATVINNLEEEVKTLEFQIPQLEEIKKAAVGRRDFKAAGKASKEIKESTTRLAECKEELENETGGRMQAAEHELSKLENELEVARKVAKEVERESGMATMKKLADNIKRLVATKVSVCVDAEERSIKGVGAFVLDAQIKALKMEGQTYGDKYGGWKELLAEIGMDDVPSKKADSSKCSEKEEQSDEKNSADEKSDEYEDNDDVPRKSDKVADTDDGLSKSEKMARFRDVSKRLKEAEENLEAAVAKEDYDGAALLDETLQQLLSEVESLNMTDEEMELALAEPESHTAVASAAIESNEGPSDAGSQTEEAAAGIGDGDEAPSTENLASGDEAQVSSVTASPQQDRDEIPEDSPTSNGEGNKIESTEDSPAGGKGDKDEIVDPDDALTETDEDGKTSTVETNGEAAAESEELDD